jgi:hypothetical protein
MKSDEIVMRGVSTGCNSGKITQRRPLLDGLQVESSGNEPVVDAPESERYCQTAHTGCLVERHVVFIHGSIAALDVAEVR